MSITIYQVEQLLEQYKNSPASQYVPLNPIRTNYVYVDEEDFQPCGYNKELHPWWGLKHTPETIKLMSKVKMGSKNPFYGKKHNGRRFKKSGYNIVINGTTYESQKAAADILKLSESTICRMVKRGTAYRC